MKKKKKTFKTYFKTNYYEPCHKTNQSLYGTTTHPTDHY